MELSYSIPELQFSTLRISTITTTAQLGVKINLENIFKQIQILPYWDLNNGILKMEYKGECIGTCFKDIMQKPKMTKTSFFNQATIVVRREISPLNWKEVNVKLFRNGGVQMTGVRSLEMSSDVLRWLLEHLNITCTDVEKPIFSSTPTIHREQVQLINTDFSIGAKVRRDVLHKILTETYGLHSSYESAIYQGVKTKYFYNAERPLHKPQGVCPCPTLCKGTGDGSKIGQCKKITISPFQTGNGIITGAREIAQINEAYEFIKMVFARHSESVLRKIYVLPDGVQQVDHKKEKKINLWIQHPCPRNIVEISSASNS
jgi:TATA-box binding protein (TBP) (component of TFIID and TFIIIB)